MKALNSSSRNFISRIGSRDVHHSWAVGGCSHLGLFHVCERENEEDEVAWKRVKGCSVRKPSYIQGRHRRALKRTWEPGGNRAAMRELD